MVYIISMSFEGGIALVICDKVIYFNFLFQDCLTYCYTHRSDSVNNSDKLE